MKDRFLNIAIFVLLVVLAVMLFSKSMIHTKETPTPHKVAVVEKKPTETPAKKPQTITAATYQIAIDHWNTTNGARVYFVQTPEMPLVDVSVNFDAGSARDGEKPGLSNLCARLLNQGTRLNTADHIAEQFESLGAQYEARIDRDRSMIKLRSLAQSDVLTPAIHLFKEIITEPLFPENSVIIEKNQVSTELKRMLQQPHSVAAKNFFETLYSEHPYAHPTLGTLEIIETIQPADLTAFHQRYFVAQNMSITVVGGISKEQAMDIATELASALPKGEKPAALPNVEALSTAKTVSIPFKSEQTHILMGQPCATENDPDYFPLIVGNYILGGGSLVSRLFEEVRDNRGLAYSVQSALMQLQKPAPFVIKLQTMGQKTKEAISVLQTNLDEFIAEGPTEAEVLDAKEALIHAFPVDISSNAKITDVVSTLGFYELPLDYLKTYIEKINQVTVETVKETFKRRIDPKKLGLVVVGTVPETTTP